MSSMLRVEALETHNSVPDLAAPSTVATSPSGCTSAWLLIGVTRTGCGSFSPSIVIEVSIVSLWLRPSLS